MVITRCVTSIQSSPKPSKKIALSGTWKQQLTSANHLHSTGWAPKLPYLIAKTDAGRCFRPHLPDSKRLPFFGRRHWPSFSSLQRANRTVLQRALTTTMIFSEEPTAGTGLMIFFCSVLCVTCRVAYHCVCGFGPKGQASALPWWRQRRGTERAQYATGWILRKTWTCSSGLNRMSLLFYCCRDSMLTGRFSKMKSSADRAIISKYKVSKQMESGRKA